MYVLPTFTFVDIAGAPGEDREAAFLAKWKQRGVDFPNARFVTMRDEDSDQFRLLNTIEEQQKQGMQVIAVSDAASNWLGAEKIPHSRMPVIEAETEFQRKYRAKDHRKAVRNALREPECLSWPDQDHLDRPLSETVAQAGSILPTQKTAFHGGSTAIGAVHAHEPETVPGKKSGGKASNRRAEARSMVKWEETLRCDNELMAKNGFTDGVPGMLRAINEERSRIIPKERTQLVVASPEFFIYINPPAIPGLSGVMQNEHGPAHVHVFCRNSAEVEGARCLLTQTQDGVRALPYPYFERAVTPDGRKIRLQRDTHKHNMPPEELERALRLVNEQGGKLWNTWQAIFADDPKLAGDIVAQPHGQAFVEAQFWGGDVPGKSIINPHHHGGGLMLITAPEKAALQAHQR